MAIERRISATYEQFEVFVAVLLRRLGRKNVQTNIVYGRAQEVDVQFGEPGDVTVVEVKMYRFRSPPAPDLFAKALSQVRGLRAAAKARNAMLVMSCPLAGSLPAAASQFPGIEVWDAKRLIELASPFPDLLKRLETLLEVSVSDVSHDIGSAAAESQQIPEQSKGEGLALSLQEVPTGRQGAYAFEGKCIEALKYLFDRDLFGWHEQHETEDGLHRRDLVCRILPNSEVWKLMLTDLKSRYVIFEFKNYSEPITQKEIVTTERYLYPSALRNLAIIISPHGCAPSAMRVISGAMREHGKLILPLTIGELTSLLVGKDQGSDPNAFLFERVDDFLMSLGR